jgi:hypothetical protein
MGDAPRPDEGESDTKAEAEPISRAAVERLRDSYTKKKTAYLMASMFLANRRADHRMACAALDMAATMVTDIEAELDVILGEAPF